MCYLLYGNKKERTYPNGKSVPRRSAVEGMPLLHVVLHLSVSHEGLLIYENIIAFAEKIVNSQKDNFFVFLLRLHVNVDKMGRNWAVRGGDKVLNGMRQCRAGA